MFQTIKKLFNNKPWLAHGAIFLILLLVHIIFSFSNNTLIALPDELGYWGQARYLAGGLPVNFFNAPYYNYGYALFLAPFFVFFQDNNHIYYATIFLNNLCLAATYGGAYYLARYIFETPKKTAVFTALVASLYPTFMAQTNFVMAENVLIPSYVFSVIILHRWLKTNSWRYLALLSFISIFLYAIHPRFIFIPFLLLAIVFCRWLLKNISSKAFFIYLITFGSFFIANNLINKNLAAVGWSQVNSYAISKLWPALTSSGGLFLFFSGVGGQFLYLLIGTFGLFILGLHFLLGRLRISGWHTLREIFADDKRLSILFILLSSFSLLAISWSTAPLGNWNGFLRADHIIYGRYNDGFIIFYLIAGLLALTNHYSFRKYFYVLPLFLLAEPIGRAYDTIKSFNSASTFNIWAVAPFFYLLEAKSIVLAAVFSATVFLILITVAKRSYKFSLIIVATLFIYLSLINRQMLRDTRQHMYKVADFAMLKELKKESSIDKLSFDMSFTGKEDPNWRTWYLSAYLYQYYLPKIKFQQFYSESGDKPRGHYVISEATWSQAKELKAELIFQDDAVGQALWRLPD